MSAQYDAAGNLTDLILRRDGSCLPTVASCWQRFAYEWNEKSELSHARRWDLTTVERSSNSAISQAVPSRAPDAELFFAYDWSGKRVLKTAADKLGVQKHTVYAFGTLEIRTTDFSAGDYVLLPQNVSLHFGAGPASARVVYSNLDMPSLSSGHQHVFLSLGDTVGSTTFLIDKATGELVEDATYQTYGAIETDYRPGRWKGYREPYKWTGKEDDIELGLTYFGARYYSPYLGTWMSADPIAIHDFGSDINPYAYVHGTPLMGVDPDGRLVFLVVIAVIVICAAIAGGSNLAVQANTVGWNRVNWGIKGVAGSALIGAAAGAATMGAGAAVGAAAGAGTGAAAAAGAVGGAAGGATAYLGSAALQGGEFSGGGFGRAVLVGAVSGFFGAAGGAAGGFAGAVEGSLAGGTMGFFVNAALGGDSSLESFGLSMGIGLASSVAMQGLQSLTSEPSSPNRIPASRPSADAPSSQPSNNWPYPGKDPNDPIGLFPDKGEYGPTGQAPTPKTYSHPKPPNPTPTTQAPPPPPTGVPPNIDDVEPCTPDNPYGVPRKGPISLWDQPRTTDAPKLKQWDGQYTDNYRSLARMLYLSGYTDVETVMDELGRVMQRMNGSAAPMGQPLPPLQPPVWGAPLAP